MFLCLLVNALLGAKLQRLRLLMLLCRLVDATLGA